MNSTTPMEVENDENQSGLQETCSESNETDSSFESERKFLIQAIQQIQTSLQRLTCLGVPEEIGKELLQVKARVGELGSLHLELLLKKEQFLDIINGLRGQLGEKERIIDHLKWKIEVRAEDLTTRTFMQQWHQSEPVVKTDAAMCSASPNFPSVSGDGGDPDPDAASSSVDDKADVELLLVNKSLIAPGKVQGVEVGFVVDNGAQVTILGEKTWQKICGSGPQLIPSDVKLKGADGKRGPEKLGEVLVPIEIGTYPLEERIKMVVANMTDDVLLGIDFWEDYLCEIKREGGTGPNRLVFRRRQSKKPFPAGSMASNHPPGKKDGGTRGEFRHFSKSPNGLE